MRLIFDAQSAARNHRFIIHWPRYHGGANRAYQFGSRWEFWKTVDEGACAD
jgi:hypothetical protein